MHHGSLSNIAYYIWERSKRVSCTRTIISCRHNKNSRVWTKKFDFWLKRVWGFPLNYFRLQGKGFVIGLESIWRTICTQIILNKNKISLGSLFLFLFSKLDFTYVHFNTSHTLKNAKDYISKLWEGLIKFSSYKKYIHCKCSNIKNECSIWIHSIIEQVVLLVNDE